MTILMFARLPTTKKSRLLDAAGVCQFGRQGRTSDQIALKMHRSNLQGRQMKTTIGVIYKDEYVREQGRWFISKRVSDFTWEDKTALSQ